MICVLPNTGNQFRRSLKSPTYCAPFIFYSTRRDFGNFAFYWGFCIFRLSCRREKCGDV